MHSKRGKIHYSNKMKHFAQTAFDYFRQFGFIESKWFVITGRKISFRTAKNMTESLFLQTDKKKHELSLMPIMDVSRIIRYWKLFRIRLDQEGCYQVVGVT